MFTSIDVLVSEAVCEIQNNRAYDFSPTEYILDALTLCLCNNYV